MNLRLTKVGVNVFQTESVPFYGLFTCGYLLATKEGTILLDPPENIREYENHLKEFGDIKHVYFTHSHKVLSAKSEDYLRSTFNSAIERPGNWNWSWNYQSKKFSTKNIDLQEEDLRVIYTPGHTKDSICILWNQGNLKILFTGDSLYVVEDTLKRTVEYSENNKELNRTLSYLKDLDVNWVYSSVGSKKMNLKIVDRKNWIDMLDRCVEAFKT